MKELKQVPGFRESKNRVVTEFGAWLTNVIIEEKLKQYGKPDKNRVGDVRI